MRPPLNEAKCTQLLSATTQSDERVLITEDGRCTIPKVSVVRDLGVQMSANFKTEAQCANAARKASAALYRLRKTVASRNPEVLLPLFKAFVRPHLEYCVQSWSPTLIKDIKTLEKVQKSFTRLFPNLRDKPYEERLKILNLFSLGRRRKRGDLIEVFKILHGYSDSGEHMFERNSNSALRGHEWKLGKRRARLDIRNHFFAFRVVNDWNKLPSEVVQAKSVTSFKRRLDDCWAVLFSDLC